MARRRHRLVAQRKVVGLSQEKLAERLGIERTTVARWESGATVTGPQPWIRPKLARILRVSDMQLAGLLTCESEDAPTVEVVLPAPETDTEEHDDVEQLRQSLHGTLGDGGMAGASLDDWDRVVARYGRATRDRPAGILIADLATDLGELHRALRRRRSASALRRLTRAAAGISGLMCLTFCKLDNRPAFRRWARTAHLAAREAGDRQTESWVLAQEAYGHYYSDNLTEAVDVARHAQAVVAAATPSVGVALAAALEARAQAAMGRAPETRAALDHAETVTSRLGGEALTPSAFGYNEAQLRFHAGSAYTHLHDATAAFEQQDRALELCMPGDYTDWAMTRLDRANCLAYSGDPEAALTYATETICGLNPPQRQGIITARGYELLAALPTGQRATPAGRDLHDLLHTTGQEEVP